MSKSSKPAPYAPVSGVSIGQSQDADTNQQNQGFNNKPPSASQRLSNSQAFNGQSSQDQQQQLQSSQQISKQSANGQPNSNSNNNNNSSKPKGMNDKEKEKKTQSAVDNAELNEYIKNYLKYNGFGNSLECFEAEINAKRMSSKLQDRKALLQKEAQQKEEIPRLYQMLKGEEIHVQRERKAEQNMKILHQKYLEMLQAGRSLFSISVKLLSEYITSNPQNEDKIDGYKKSIGQFRKLVLDEGKPTEKDPPTLQDIVELKEKLQELTKKAAGQSNIQRKDSDRPQSQASDKSNSKDKSPNGQSNSKDNGVNSDTTYQVTIKDMKNTLVQFRLDSLESASHLRMQYVQSLIEADILDLEHIDNPKTHYILLNLSKYEHFIKHQLIALISMVCSIHSGREYILQKDKQNLLLKAIIDTMKSQEKGTVTQRFCIAVLAKLSLHEEASEVMTKEGLVIFLVQLISSSSQENSSGDPAKKVHVFTLEYSAATILNLLSDDTALQVYIEKQPLGVQLIEGVLSCLDDGHSIQTNKYLLRILALFTKDKFQQAILETSYDEKINNFLDILSNNSDEDYKTQLLTFHAQIFTKEMHKVDLDREQQAEYDEDMQDKYDENQDSFDDAFDDEDEVIIFEHFNDELTDQLLNGQYVQPKK